MSTIVTRSGKGSPLTHAEVDSNFTNLNTDKLELSGGTLTGTLNFGDNVKAQFGASADLQVFHDGANSFIKDAGTGNLRIDATNLQLRNGIGTETYATFTQDGAVDLYYDNSKKLATTSTGIDVTGTVVADGATIGESTANTTVTVGGSYANGIELAQNGIDATSSARLFFDSTTDTSAIYNSGGDLTIAKAATVGSSSGNKSMTLGSNGDISFYEDTGTTAKFFWDASQENLGIGTNAPNSAADLHIHSTSGTALWLTSNGGNPSDAGFIRMSEQSDGSGAYFELQHDGSNNVLNLYSSNQGSTVQSWDRVGGDVNFHNSSGTAKLTWDAGNEELQLASGAALSINGWTITESGGSLYFATGGTNKMKLDASGNLDVVGSVNANATIT